jgi:hypothetical protein
MNSHSPAPSLLWHMSMALQSCCSASCGTFLHIACNMQQVSVVANCTYMYQAA